MATFTARDLTLALVVTVRILGIDPGTQVVGYGCLELDASAHQPGDVASAGAVVPLAMRGSNVVRLGDSVARGSHAVRLVAAGVLRLGGRGVAVSRRLLELQRQFAALVQQFAPSELAIEEAFYGKSVQAALRIGEARGVVLAEAGKSDLTVHQYAPARIKRCIAGHGAARKQSVASMLQQIVPGAAELLGDGVPLDASDAVAVAWTRFEERCSPLRSRT